MKIESIISMHSHMRVTESMDKPERVQSLPIKAEAETCISASGDRIRVSRTRTGDRIIPLLYILALLRELK